MPSASETTNAERVRSQLCELLGHEQIEVRPRGGHLVIHLVEEDASSIVARLTPLQPNLFVAAFRNHSGRWEPLPGEGSLELATSIVFSCLEPYLQPYP